MFKNPNYSGMRFDILYYKRISIKLLFSTLKTIFMKFLKVVVNILVIKLAVGILCTYNMLYCYSLPSLEDIYDIYSMIL